jgi:hypothetical protein
MSAPEDGGPMFPQFERVGDVAFTKGGMTLRDWFAGQALVGYLAAFANPSALSVESPGSAASAAYKYADAMLHARDGAA